MVTHLFFADNSLLFCRANVQECHKLIEILELYDAASSQKVNAEKSSIFFSHNTPPRKKVCSAEHPWPNARHKAW